MENKEKPEKDVASTESEIRGQRKFSLAEAIARENAGNLKGASPVARGRQVLLEIQHILESILFDPPGSLRRTILTDLENNVPLLARHFDHPAGALAEYLQAALEHPTRLEILVRDTDARWGREYQEKPHFETAGGPAHPDDPYTLAGVADICRVMLTELGPEKA